ncbi:STAS domain-containing protein [Streptomyces hygroscopicus subsp. hygroscopicus]|uniref:STAS domain-containing protein n=1 Tax=Streptomyces hygroscopicus TaxID=1912 RepID=UPI001C65F26F|nr:STAS domain-containing protein [Streptomyces hygroscopicus]MBW8092329.1 STAS domain-containing protein [Streptomyces hygroscopicus subsp. hygroscopicus]
MTQPGAPRRAAARRTPVPPDRGARSAAQGPADGDPAAQGSAEGDLAVQGSADGDPAARGLAGGGSAAQGLADGDPAAQGLADGDLAAQGSADHLAAQGSADGGLAAQGLADGDPAGWDGAAADAAAPRVHTHRVGAYTVVELHGEIDIAGVGSVGPGLDAATAGDEPAVIVDLRPTAFFDCSGLGLLCRAHRRVMERGGRMRLVCDNALILRTLRAGRLLDVLRPVATLDEALREE